LPDLLAKNKDLFLARHGHGKSLAQILRVTPIFFPSLGQELVFPPFFFFCSDIGSSPFCRLRQLAPFLPTMEEFTLLPFPRMFFAIVFPLSPRSNLAISFLPPYARGVIFSTPLPFAKGRSYFPLDFLDVRMVLRVVPPGRKQDVPSCETKCTVTAALLFPRV